jgi:4,5-dihydroxyphthalate decarboxylase
MSDTIVRVATLDYDHVMPLLLGRVPIPGIDLRLRTDQNLRTAKDNPDLDVVECSLARHLQDLAAGEDSWVAIPVGPRRQFCHRAWFVAQDSPATDFGGLDDRPIGITEFPASGNTWARQAAREAGMDVDAKRWVVASFDGTGPRGHDRQLAANVTDLPSDAALSTLLRSGEISAAVSQTVPEGFYEGRSGVRRLFPDYVAAETGYYRRTGIFPSHHVLAVRSEYLQTQGHLLPAIVAAFQTSRRLWEASRLRNGDTSAWSMADLERTMEIIGPDWQAYGTTPLLPIVAALAEELTACGLTDHVVDPGGVFAAYESVAASGASPLSLTSGGTR